MGGSSELDFTMRELRSFLPAGWRADPEDLRGWDASRGAWIALLRDGSGLSWEVSVGAAALETSDRLEALRQAIERTVRRRR